MDYVAIDDMVVDVGLSLAFVTLKLPVALANLRDKKAAIVPIVIRKRATARNMLSYLLPTMSDTEKVALCFQILDCKYFLKEDLTFSENQELPEEWQNSIRQRNIPQVANEMTINKDMTST